MQQKQDWSRWAVPAVLVAGTAISLFARFRAGDAFLAFFDDDFFYYLRIAQNIAAGHGSTFDGTHLTNGYHPLWMGVIILLVKLFAGRAFFYALLTLIAICVLATYWFAAECLRTYGSAAAARCCAALIAADALLIMTGGMEIVLTIPLLALLCWFRVQRFQWTPRSAVVYGLLCSAVVLSRLDAALLVVMLAVFDLLWAGEVPWRARLRAAAGYVLGMLPIVLYLVANRVIFDTFMPVSGQAKQLRHHHLPSLLPFRTALLTTWAPLRFFLVLPVLCAAALAVALLWTRGPERLRREHRALVAALLCFPLLHLLVISILSDWPIWPWYLYPFAAAAIGVCLVLFSRAGSLETAIVRFATPVTLVGFVSLLGIFCAVQWRNSRRPDKLIYSMYFGAQDLKAFAATHPGVYAMGDRAGTPGLLVREPIVQLEGLVMDKPFLENFRQERDLKQVLAAYHVRYYVATNPTPVDGCLRATEPMAGGADSYVMHGTFCSAPVDQFFHNGYQTYVFDMDRELGRGDAGLMHGCIGICFLPSAGLRLDSSLRSEWRRNQAWLPTGSSARCSDSSETFLREMWLKRAQMRPTGMMLIKVTTSSMVPQPRAGSGRILKICCKVC